MKMDTITILYPEAKATIVTKSVNKEVDLLTTKTMKVACRLCSPRREAAVSSLKLTNSIWVWFRVPELSCQCGCGSDIDIIDYVTY